MHPNRSIAKRSIVALAIAAVSMLPACDLASVLDFGRASTLCAKSHQGHCPTEDPAEP